MAIRRIYWAIEVINGNYKTMCDSNHILKKIRANFLKYTSIKLIFNNNQNYF